MKQEQTLLSLIPWTLAGLLTACGGDSGETEFSTISMRLTLDDSATSAADDSSDEDAPADVSITYRLVEQGGHRLTVEQASVFIRHVEFDLPEGAECEAEHTGDVCDEDKLSFDGPWVVDLMTGAADPDLSELRVPAGTYKRVDVRLDDAESDEAHDIDGVDSLHGNTLVVSGTYSGPEAERFELSLKFNEDARFEHEDEGLQVEAGGVRDMVLSLDVAEWFESVDLAKCAEDGDLEVRDGVLIIDESGDCSDVENDLKDAIKNSAQWD